MTDKGKAGLCALLLVPALLIGGCSRNKVVNYKKSSDNITTITFFGNKYEPENVTVIEEIISGFMKENPQIQVSYESLKGSEYYEALKKRMAAGKGNDVFMVNHDTVLEFEEKGQLENLSDLSTIPDYTYEMMNQMMEGEHIYWVPTTVSAFGLYCNQDLLEQNNQKIPENLKEWESVCEYFAEKGITPIIANNDISLKSMAIGKGFYSLYEEGSQAEIFAGMNRGEVKLSTYLSSGFALAKEFIDKGYIDGEKALNTEKTSDDLQEFLKGESPFMITGAWAAGRVAGMEPDFSFQVVPFPVLDEGTLIVINADTRLAVNADSEHPEEVKKFVEYFTRADNIQKFADQQSSFSPLTGGEPSSAEEIQPLVSCYQAGRTVIGADRLLDLPIWDLTAQVSRKLLSGETLEETMSWLDQQQVMEEEH